MQLCVWSTLDIPAVSPPAFSLLQLSSLQQKKNNFLIKSIQFWLTPLLRLTALQSAIREVQSILKFYRVGLVTTSRYLQVHLEKSFITWVQSRSKSRGGPRSGPESPPDPAHTTDEYAWQRPRKGIAGWVTVAGTIGRKDKELVHLN